jgi:hypothetical protein
VFEERLRSALPGWKGRVGPIRPSAHKNLTDLGKEIIQIKIRSDHPPHQTSAHSPKSRLVLSFSSLSLPLRILAQTTCNSSYNIIILIPTNNIQSLSIPNFFIKARAGPPHSLGRSSSFTIGRSSSSCAPSLTFRPRLTWQLGW